MATAKPTGYVRTIERKGGAVFYAKLKLPDGSQPQRQARQGVDEGAAARRRLPDARDGRGAACRRSSPATTRS